MVDTEEENTIRRAELEEVRIVLYMTQSGEFVSEKVIEDTCETIFKSMKSELSEEVQTYEVYVFVLEECKRRLRGKRMCL